jgi:agmatine deiminase
MTSDTATSSSLMPAEWEPHAATWIAWPHNADDWPGKLAAVEWAYGEIVRRVSPGEAVRILVNDGDHRQQAGELLGRVGVEADRVEFFEVPTNRGWTRDMGPMFVRCSEAGRAAGVSLLTEGTRDDARENPQTDVWGSPGGGVDGSQGSLAIVNFGFNGWAKYDNWQLDNAVPEHLAERLGLPVVPVVRNGKPVVLEGGAIDVNGAGSLLTTEECLLDPNVQVRNPGLRRADMEAVLAEALGATNVIWLGNGIVGDDTHGHVDDLCRFVNRTTVVLAQEDNSNDANYRLLQENRERLESARLEDGSKIDVVPLPMPQPLFLDGIRLPASYANFYIANAAVLVPTFNDPHDRIALGILAELFDRPVIGIHAVDLVWGLGTLHCLTQQQPATGSDE